MLNMKAHTVNALTLIAHRGLSGHAPENTAAAIEAAFRAGIAWVELDVSQLRDGTLVIWHDDDLQRCSNGQGTLVDCCWADVQQLDCGSWFHSGFSGERLLTLERALTLIKKLGMGLNLELKAHARDAGQYIDLVERRLHEAGMDNRKLLISSFDPELLVLTKARAPQRPLGVLTETIHHDTWALATSVNACTIVAEHTHLSPEQVYEVRRRGYGMITYTANHPQQVGALIQAGLNAVISDFPGRYYQTHRDPGLPSQPARRAAGDIEYLTKEDRDLMHTDLRHP